MHDKNLSRQDFKELQKRLSSLKNLRATSEENRKIQTRVGSIWSGLMKSSRHYRSNPLQLHLSVPEWLSYWSDFVKSARSCKGWPAMSDDGQTDYTWHTEFIDLIFDVADTKGDEYIDKEEYTLFLTVFGLSAVNCEKSFTYITRQQTNGHKLDKNRFKDLWFEFITSEDEDSPGSFLFGNPLMTLDDQN
ncbi:hypothetical protein SNE40_008210 [Patella caerulea]